MARHAALLLLAASSACVRVLPEGERRKAYGSVLPPPPSLVPCNASVRHLRIRSKWCEQDGRQDAFITFSEIEEGLCLDGQCYDAVSLSKWLKRNEILPHNRAHFSISQLNYILGIGAATLRANGFVMALAVGDAGILTGSLDGSVQLFDPITFAELRSFDGHSGSVHSVRFSPDGSKVLSAGHDKIVRLWSTKKGELLHSFSGHIELVYTAIFAADGAKVLTASDDQAAVLWDTASGEELNSMAVDGMTVSGAAFYKDDPASNTEIFVGIAAGRICAWDAETGAERFKLDVNNGTVEKLVFSRAGGRLAAVLESRTAVVVLDVEFGRELTRIESIAIVLTAVLSPDGSRLLVGRSDAKAVLFDALTGAELQRYSVPRNVVVAADFAPDGRLVAVSAGDEVFLYDSEPPSESGTPSA